MMKEKEKLIRKIIYFWGVFATCYAFAFGFLTLGFFYFQLSFRIVSFMALLIGLWSIYEMRKLNKQLKKLKK